LRFSRLVVVLSTLTLILQGAAPALARDEGPSGSRALSGQVAAAFVLPGDVYELWRATLPGGRLQVRYQQRVADADVLGGQLTVISNAVGATEAVIGAHYPGLVPRNQRSISAKQAAGIATQRFGAAAGWQTTLMIDPADGRLFYWAESLRFDSRPVLWIDAGSGAVRNSYDAIAHDGPGIGVKGDTKTVDSSGTTGAFVLISDDGRQATYDMQNSRAARNAPGVIFTDADDTWDTPGVQSPGQPAGVDAHFYADLVDAYYSSTFLRDSIDNAGMPIISSVHYGHKYNNAFWNGLQMTYGDGDQREFREFSASLEVVGHELTHGVTQYTSNLVYQGESGALNEAFSDIIGASIENATNEPLSSHCVVVAGYTDCADWALGEDLIINNTDTIAGFRNMADPAEDEDPDHYSELINDPSDGGGVHSNSGVPNHAYFLLVNGGINAGCDAVGSDGHIHTADCGTVVTGIGLSAAQQIFYAGFTSLHSTANMCDARNATVALAGASAANVSAAWQAVGIDSTCTGNPPVSCDVPIATIPFESEHPYNPDQNCTWTYDNGTANFMLHFSLLDTENGFDFVNVIPDGATTPLHAYTGTYRGGTTTECITTQTVDVQLVSDQLINKRGFIVDAAIPC
jgi:bacillolysin